MRKPAQVQSQMIQLGREARALTQTELAALTGLRQSHIAKFESGLLRVSNEHLEKIASALAYPKAFFLVAEQKYSFGTSCTYHRKRQTMPVQELRTLLAQINIHRIRLKRLLDGVDFYCENQFQRLDIEDFDGDAERIAQLVRASWKLPLGPLENLVGAIERAGGIVHKCSFGTKKLDAISQWIPGLGLPPLFFVNTDIPGDRGRFTLAHELGHLIMHQIPSTDMEGEADRFAAEFLMPADDISAQLSVVTLPVLAQLKPYWKVSMAALARRAYDLDKITNRQYRYLFEQLSKLGYRISEPIVIPVEKPTLLKRIIELHQTDGDYSISDLSELALALEEEFLLEYLFDDRPLRVIKGSGKQEEKVRQLKA